MRQPAVFLDRDGTINEEMGYINHLSRFKLLPHSAPGIRRLNEAGFKVIVVTNQSGAARGYFPRPLIDQVHEQMRELLAAGGARLDGIYLCDHHPDDRCNCRKPKPDLILQAATEHGVDLSRSFLVGDRYMDIQTAVNAGVRGVLVLTGYGLGEYEQFRDSDRVQPAHVSADLLEAAEWIVDVDMGGGPGVRG